MAGSSKPGPLCQFEKAIDIDDGTSPLTGMPQPGPVGAAKVVLPIPGVTAAAWIVMMGSVMAEGVRCLLRLEDQMHRQTERYLVNAAGDGHFRTSPAGVRFIPEDHADAFGHCWIACQGTMTCGAGVTRELGEAREIFREVMEVVTLAIWSHNGYEEDMHNQRVGRRIALTHPGGDSFALTYDALIGGALKFHGHNTSGDASTVRVYNCFHVAIGGRSWAAGWRSMPRALISTLHDPGDLLTRR